MTHHEPEHNHEHNHDHGHDEHDHTHSSNPILDWFQHTLFPHSHGHQEAALDAALATDRGIWAVKVSLVGLLATAAFQVVIVLISGSVALLADTIHNFSDALTAIPLGIAFTLSRRARNLRYTYGYGRAEDIAGVIIVLMILFSAFEAIYQAILKIINPQPISNILWVAIAAVVGFLGNELVAIFRIRVGKQIGSAALVADGYHARTDGFTSLAVLAGAAGVTETALVAILYGPRSQYIPWRGFLSLENDASLRTHRGASPASRAQPPVHNLVEKVLYRLPFKVTEQSQRHLELLSIFSSS